MSRKILFGWIRRTGERANTNDNGSVAVEFALVSVPLMVLLFGMIGFGITFAQKQALSNAARDAARTGVVTYTVPITCDSLVTKAVDLSKTIGTSRALTVVTVSGGWAPETPICAGVGVEPSGSSPTTSSLAEPCMNAEESDTNPDPDVDTSALTVTITHQTQVELLFASPTFSLVGKGTFRCEYSQ